jgi:hypothetical protein
MDYVLMDFNEALRISRPICKRTYNMWGGYRSEEEQRRIDQEYRPLFAIGRNGWQSNETPAEMTRWYSNFQS